MNAVVTSQAGGYRVCEHTAQVIVYSLPGMRDTVVLDAPLTTALKLAGQYVTSYGVTLVEVAVNGDVLATFRPDGVAR